MPKHKTHNMEERPTFPLIHQRQASVGSSVKGTGFDFLVHLDLFGHRCTLL